MTALRATATVPAQLSPGAIPKLHAVLCWKSTGKTIVFDRYATRSEADAIVQALARVGCSAFVESV